MGLTKSDMTHKQFKRHIAALGYFGESGKHRLANELGCSDRSIYHWELDGDPTPIPEMVARLILSKLEKK